MPAILKPVVATVDAPDLQACRWWAVLQIRNIGIDISARNSTGIVMAHAIAQEVWSSKNFIILTFFLCWDDSRSDPLKMACSMK